MAKVAAIENFLLDAGCAAIAARNFAIVAEEIFTNIVRYAWRDREPGSCAVDLGAVPQENSLRVTLRTEDDGIAFDPTKAEAPDLEAALEDRPVGGLGIGLIKSLAAECGVNLTRDNPELPVGSDLFNFIVAYRRISDPFAQIITRQVLQGVEYLHANQIVHRDMKTENVVVGMIRRAVLKRDENGVCVGATFFEKVDCKVIDFGLVKYMNISNAAVVSPGAFIRATESSAASPDKNKNKNNDDDDDDDDEEEEDEKAKLAAQQWGQVAQNNIAPIQRPPEAGTINAFDAVAVTPCGTEIYCSLEALTGILNAGLGQARAKWSSSKQTLPKMDVFGIGAILYCLSNGKPPFRPLETYRRISREERMRQIERLVAAGPVFISAASQPSRSMTMRLMDNDVARRYSSSQALLDPFVQHNSDTVVTESTLEGIVAIACKHDDAEMADFIGGPLAWAVSMLTALCNEHLKCCHTTEGDHRRTE